MSSSDFGSQDFSAHISSTYWLNSMRFIVFLPGEPYPNLGSFLLLTSIGCSYIGCYSKAFLSVWATAAVWAQFLRTFLTRGRRTPEKLKGGRWEFAESSRDDPSEEDAARYVAASSDHHYVCNTWILFAESEHSCMSCTSVFKSYSFYFQLIFSVM